ncbi:MAG: hypothetical protein KKF00_08045, partial [Proteobacteria bacterium]|nr:hypothetical protein [Pseudomonadota bacterium]
MNNLFRKKQKVSKLLFSIIVVFVVVLNACSIEAKSLKKGEVYRSLDGAAIEVISGDELEITEGGKTTVARYGFKDDKLRVVIGDTVIYFEIVKEWLKDEKSGKVYYTKDGLVKKRTELAALEEKKR